MREFVMLVLAFDLISQELHLRLSIVHLQWSQIYWSRSNCAQFVCKMHLNEFEFSLSSGEKKKLLHEYGDFMQSPFRYVS